MGSGFQMHREGQSTYPGQPHADLPAAFQDLPLRSCHWYRLSPKPGLRMDKSLTQVWLRGEERTCPSPPYFRATFSSKLPCLSETLRFNCCPANLPQSPPLPPQSSLAPSPDPHRHSAVWSEPRENKVRPGSGGEHLWPPAAGRKQEGGRCGLARVPSILEGRGPGPGPSHPPLVAPHARLE